MLKKMVGLGKVVVIVVLSLVISANAFAMSKTVKVIIGVTCLAAGGFMMMEGAKPKINIKENAIKEQHTVWNGDGVTAHNDSLAVNSGIYTITLDYPDAWMIYAGMGLAAIGGGWMFYVNKDHQPVVGYQTKF